MNRSNIPILRFLSKRHNTVRNMARELNTYALSQPRKNAILRRIKESIGRKRLSAENSQLIAKAMASSDNPIEIIKYIRRLPVSTKKRHDLMSQAIYFLEEQMPTNEHNKFMEIYAAAMKENHNNPNLESILASSGAFD
jgi:hypothetical protein